MNKLLRELVDRCLMALSEINETRAAHWPLNNDKIKL